jgi:5'-nucleotidase/UDP-sugar diphosphatase
VAVKDGSKLIAIDDQIPGDAMTQGGVNAYIGGLDMALAPSGVTYKKVVAETTFDLAKPEFQEMALGNLVTDAYRTVASSLTPTEPVDIAIEANGQIRSDIKKGAAGQIWFADLFRVIPLGVGPVDHLPGYPLVTFYANGKDLKSGAELSLAAETPVIGHNDQYFLQISGLQIQYDATKVVFGKVTGLALVPSPGAAPVPIDIADTTKCYKVVTNLYVANLLGLVNKLTMGALSVEAKDKDCQTKLTPTDLAAHILFTNPMTMPPTELKAWQAVLGYVQKLPDSDMNSVPNLPASLYMSTQDRYKKN